MPQCVSSQKQDRNSDDENRTNDIQIINFGKAPAFVVDVPLKIKN